VLHQRDLTSYLLEKGLIEPGSIVSGDLVLQDASRRNRNFKILSKQGRCYFLKQGIGPLPSIEREAAIYRFLSSLPGVPYLAGCLPVVSFHDHARQILVLEIPPRTETLDEYCRWAGRTPTWAGELIGRALGDVHRLTRDQAIEGSPGAKFAEESPWVFRIHEPVPRIFWGASDANQRLVRIIQEFVGLREHLDRLREDWRVECLIHGDLKSPNLVLERGPSGRVRRALKIVDWELAGFGDAAWDIGSILSDSLALWLLSIPMGHEMPVEQSLGLARLPLKAIAPAMQSFWSAYVDQRDLDSKGAEELLRRSASHAAARLLQTAYETTRQSSQIPANILYMVQLSWNMMRSPSAAVAGLLGLTGTEEIS